MGDDGKRSKGDVSVSGNFEDSVVVIGDGNKVVYQAPPVQRQARRRELTQFISVSLERLSDTQGLSCFRSICRQHARTKICEYVVASAGPVGVNDSIGRDFESYRSFRGGGGGEDLAFACCVHRPPLLSTTKAAISKIMADGERPDAVYFYCAHPFEQGPRQAFQKWARHAFDLEVYVLDGTTLAEELAQPELAWVAVEYLNVSPLLIPNDSEAETEYDRVLARSANIIPRDVGIADFMEIRWALRTLTEWPTRRLDLQKWLDLLVAISESSNVSMVCKDLARYECLVMSVKVRSSMIGLEDTLRRTMLVREPIRPSWLSSQVTLLGYATGMVGLAAVNVTWDDIGGWHNALYSAAESELQVEARPGRRSLLLESLGLLELFAPDRSDPDRFNSAVERWCSAIDSAVGTAFYSAEQLAELVEKLSHVIVESPKYRELTHKLDALLAQRQGQTRSAAACARRAQVLENAGLKTEAIHEYHAASIHWFHADTMQESLRSTLHLGWLYFDLGCPFATKLYALAVYRLSCELDDPDYFSHAVNALCLAALAETNCGAWVHGFQLAATAVVVQDVIGEPDMDNGHPIGIALDVLALIGKGASELNGDWEAWASGVIERLPARPQIKSLQTDQPSLKSDQPPTWLNASGSPFQDVAPARTYIWKAVGISFSFEWETAPETADVAETFVAMMQIALVDAVEHDFEFLPDSLQVEISVNSELDIGVADWDTGLPGVVAVSLPVISPDSERPPDLLIFPAVAMLLRGLSVHPEFDELLKKQVQDGLFTKMVKGDHFYRLRTAGTLPGLENPPWTSVESTWGKEVDEETTLAWKPGLSPIYDVEQAKRLLEQRYLATCGSLRYTLPKLLDNESFRPLVMQLRLDGWLGWQILAAISTITAQHRLSIRNGGASRDPEVLVAEVLELIRTKEPNDGMEPPEGLLDADVLRRQLEFNMIASLQVFGLDLWSPSPNIKAVKRYLSERFRYFEDDIPALDPLPR